MSLPAAAARPGRKSNTGRIRQLLVNKGLGDAEGHPRPRPRLPYQKSAATGPHPHCPGAGITHSNIAKVAEQTGAIEFHADLGSVLPYSSRDYAAFESQVRQLADQLGSLS